MSSRRAGWSPIQQRKPRPAPRATSLEVGGATSIGLVRGAQEDSALIDRSLHLYGVADGMGGHAHGDLASQLAVLAIHNVVRWNDPPTATVAEQLRVAVQEANTLVWRASRGELADDLYLNAHGFHGRLPRHPTGGMGTTVCVMRLDEQNGEVVVANVGDSRCYLWRAGRLYQATKDHRPGPEYPANILTRAVGTGEQVEVDIYRIKPQEGDIFLLCTDGIHGPVPDLEIQRLLRDASPQAGADLLVAAALEAGGPDNATAIVAHAS